MNNLKKILGLLWLLIGPLVIYFLIHGAISNISSHGEAQINNPVIWIIIITIFTPISIGLMIFGWYAFKGEYTQLPESSTEL